MTATALRRLSDEELHLLKAAYDAHQAGRASTGEEQSAIRVYEAAISARARPNVGCLVGAR